MLKDQEKAFIVQLNDCATLWGYWAGKNNNHVRYERKLHTSAYSHMYAITTWSDVVFRNVRNMTMYRYVVPSDIYNKARETRSTIPYIVNHKDDIATFLNEYFSRCPSLKDAFQGNVPQNASQPFRIFWLAGKCLVALANDDMERFRNYTNAMSDLAR